MAFDQWYRQNNIITDYTESDLDFEKSIHHILNYEWSKKGKMIRFEVFDKQYDNLVLLNSESCDGEYCLNNLTNGGDGYSRGAEVFWRYDKTDDGIGDVSGRLPKPWRLRSSIHTYLR